MLSRRELQVLLGMHQVWPLLPGPRGFLGAFHPKAMRNESRVHSNLVSSRRASINARWVLCVSGDVFEDVCTSGEWNMFCEM